MLEPVEGSPNKICKSKARETERVCVDVSHSGPKKLIFVPNVYFKFRVLFFQKISEVWRKRDQLSFFCGGRGGCFQKDEES